MLKPLRTGVDRDSIEADGLDENLERVAEVAVVLDDECSMAVPPLRLVTLVGA